MLGDILPLSIEDTALTTSLTPEQRYEHVKNLIVALVLAEARRQPLLLILDDLHWADALPLDLLARLARAADVAALLILLSYRLDPLITEPWRELGHCTRLEIRELSSIDSTALVQAVLQGTPPPGLAKKR